MGVFLSGILCVSGCGCVFIWYSVGGWLWLCFYLVFCGWVVVGVFLSDILCVSGCGCVFIWYSVGGWLCVCLCLGENGG